MTKYDAMLEILVGHVVGGNGQRFNGGHSLDPNSRLNLQEFAPQQVGASIKNPLTGENNIGVVKVDAVAVPSVPDTLKI